MVKKNLSFWQQLETKSFTKEKTEQSLLTKLGQPSNQTQTNLYQEIIKKINSYYFTQEIENQTIHSLIGSVSKITQKVRKKGKHRGETKYLLEISEPKGTILQAYQENLPPAKWQQIQKLTILNKKLVFKYKKWITNKDLLDFDKPRTK